MAQLHQHQGARAQPACVLVQDPVGKAALDELEVNQSL